MIDAPGTEFEDHQPASGRNYRVIHATCKTHSGAIGFTNLVVSKHGGRIELDPHVTGQCVITLEEDATRVLYELLGEWLG
ncbi:MAG TPA: hypothetical protein VIY28_05190 [Pseudonocardiaceae bacterium]